MDKKIYESFFTVGLRIAVTETESSNWSLESGLVARSKALLDLKQLHIKNQG